MSAYIYGRTNKTKTYQVNGGGSVVIGNIKYLFKPAGSCICLSEYGDKLERQQDAMVLRYENNWEGKEFPALSTVCDNTTGVSMISVVDTSTVVNSSGNPVHIGATFYDDPYGFGDEVGTLKKVKGKWVYFPHDVYVLTDGISVLNEKPMHPDSAEYLNKYSTECKGGNVYWVKK